MSGTPPGARRGEAVDKRRVILDAAVRVFARRGFHACRVADIAVEAGVAYGLVYHYFASKDEILDTVFSERWHVLLEAIAEADESDAPPREQLYAIASFIIDSYRHDPDVMKVIVVEVTRAANSFGRTHLPEIDRAYAGIAGIVRAAQDTGTFTRTVPAEHAALAFYGIIEQLLSAWVFELLPRGERDYDEAKQFVVETVCGGLERSPASADPASGPAL